MKYLIVNADDFGLNSDVNEAIIRAWEEGAITNSTLMTNREGSEEAFKYALANPDFPVGLHLDLDKVICGEAQGAERFEKKYLARRLLKKGILSAIEKEIESQIRCFKDSGLELTHIDGHHHLHALPDVFPPLLDKMVIHNIQTVRVSKSYDLVSYPPIEWNDRFAGEMQKLLLEKGVGSADHFMSSLTPEGIKSLPEGVTEFMVHPGIKETWRSKDLDMLFSAEWKESLREKGIKLVSFKDRAHITAKTP